MKYKFVTLEEWTKDQMKDPKFADEYNKFDLGFEIALMVTGARIEAGLTQEELAEKIGTKQSSIARVENGGSVPSLSFLVRIAKGLNTNLDVPHFSKHPRGHRAQIATP